MITEAIAIKVRDTIDAGLVSGLGEPVPGQMCVEAAFALVIMVAAINLKLLIALSPLLLAGWAGWWVLFK